MEKVRIGIGILAAAVLSLSLGTAGYAADTAPAAEKPKPPKKMMINGMFQGVLRVPEVAIWECPGGPMGGCNRVGQLKHGTEVMRHESENARGLKWYHIVGGGLDGWVKSDFLKSPGT